MTDRHEDLPEEFARALAEYERHLVSERDLTPHTVRAYPGDVSGMLAHAAALGHGSLDDLDVRTLRSWLANQKTLGKARTTMARRATAVRVFSAWAARTGRATRDPGAQLGSPKAHTSLPPALDLAEAGLAQQVGDSTRAAVYFVASGRVGPNRLDADQVLEVGAHRGKHGLHACDEIAHERRR